MPILSQILDDVFKKLSRLETVYRSPTDYDLPKKNFAEIWKIETEVQTSIFQKEIELYVAFDEFFPLSIPRIYLSQKSFDEVAAIHSRLTLLHEGDSTAGFYSSFFFFFKI